jgi:hypothetical protein
VCCNNFSLGRERRLLVCVYVCADGHLLLLICFLTLASALWFSIFCAETLSLLSRHSRLRAAALLMQTAGFMIISAAMDCCFYRALSTFCPETICTPSHSERETDVYVYCCVPGRESGEHKNISTLAPRLRLARVF